MPGDMRDAFKKAGVRVPPKRAHGGGKSGKRGRRPSRPRARTFPDSYFQQDDGGHRCLRIDFVSRDKLEPLVEALRRQRLTNGQMRRFFNHCREIERLLMVEGHSWDRVAARFASISAHAHNAAASKKIPRPFRTFIDENVRRVLASDHPREAFLMGFIRHFEALVGFSAGRLQ